ncbi:hypothetical protein [Arthrobacter polaris]|nr:hypothetical protein [Arthrobacter polaris]UIK89011.1 hypothetical protein J0916_00400 [Arthrobacter polaris]
MTNEQFEVIAGIDTHADTHHVALITDYGKGWEIASSWPSDPGTKKSLPT